MQKKITGSQFTGEIGEQAARLQFLRIGFQFDTRSRLEAGIDGIAEVMDDDRPTAKMIAVQVKATEAKRYDGESDEGFTYRLKSADFEYWRGANLPVILVLYRSSDDSIFWKSLDNLFGENERTLRFDKELDRLDKASKDRLAALTVPKQGHGYYVPPLGGGEDAIVNMLPLTFPNEIFVAQTQFSTAQALAKIKENEGSWRFDWMINESSLWTFENPLHSKVRDLVERDQVEKIETDFLAAHDSLDHQHKFAGLLRYTLAHQFRRTLGWDKEKSQFYFLPVPEKLERRFHYRSAINKTHADVVSVYRKGEDDAPVDYVRHHSFAPRFERLGDQWYLIVSPSYYFTSDGKHRLQYPDGLLSGKKRKDNNNSVRGQVIMWQRFLSGAEVSEVGGLLAADKSSKMTIGVGAPPSVMLPRSVPEDVWSPKKGKKKGDAAEEAQVSFEL